jgi:hypothetical protein
LADPQARAGRGLAGVRRAHSHFNERLYARRVASVILEAAGSRRN